MPNDKTELKYYVPTIHSPTGFMALGGIIPNIDDLNLIIIFHIEIWVGFSHI